jgi:hypothetical protein
MRPMVAATLRRDGAPQARIIAGSADPYETLDPVHFAYHRRNRERGRMSGQVRIRVRYRNLRGPWFDYLLASKTEMKQLLEDTGWAIARFLDAEGPYYLAIVEKQDS